MYHEGMEQKALADIFGRWNSAGVQYLVVGGLAVVAHGYARLTMDTDVVLGPEVGNLRKALEVLGGLGFKPRAPVPLEDFADAAKRRSWALEKHMLVFTVWSSAYPLTEVDLFLECPFPSFDKAYERALKRDVAPGVPATFAGLEDLIALKRKAGRPKDLEDIRMLRELGRE